MSGEEDERPAGAVAGTACLTVPAAKRKQQPCQRRRRLVRGKEGDRPVRAVAGTAFLTVPAVKRKQLPFQRRLRPVEVSGRPER